MKKKLIFITEALWTGGIETALINLLKRLDDDRYEVTCLVLKNSLDLIDRFPADCRLIVADRQKPVTFQTAYRYRRMYNLMEEPQGASALRRLIWRLLRLTLRAPEARRYAAYIREQLGEERFDTAVIYSDRAAETAVRAVQADRFLMFYHHGSMRREYHDGYGYRKAQKIIAVSEAQAEKLRQYRPAYAEKIIAVNNLIDVAGVREKSREAPEIVFPGTAVNLVCCGRLAVEKGMDLAVEACRLLVQEGFRQIHWWIVGGGPEEEALRRMVREAGLDAYISFLGMQTNPYPYIRQADIYVQPSRIEGHPLTVLEAQVLGRPILATRTDGSRAILSDRETGCLCDISAEAIADGVKELLTHPELRKQLSERVEMIDFEKKNEAILQKLYREIG